MEKFSIALTHRLWKVRDEALVCLQLALNQSVPCFTHTHLLLSSSSALFIYVADMSRYI